MIDTFNQYKAELEIHGPAGLELLNKRVPHRFTAVYELSGKLLRNLFLYDKKGEVAPDYLQVVPFDHSFCQFVLRDGIFLTEDSAVDRRLDGHPYQGVMVSYHGVPLLDNQSELFGTLCHFDVVSYQLPEVELALLQRAARELPRYLSRSPAS
jgi:GAF domain-containing protein